MFKYFAEIDVNFKVIIKIKKLEKTVYKGFGGYFYHHNVYKETIPYYIILEKNKMKIQRTEQQEKENKEFMKHLEKEVPYNKDLSRIKGEMRAKEMTEELNEELNEELIRVEKEVEQAK